MPAITAAPLQYQESPVIGIVAKRGSGKTLLMTGLAEAYHQGGIKVFANYGLKVTPFKYVDFDTLASFPEWLHDGAIFMDEIHIGADSYDFFASRVRNITAFVTQLRKRNLTFYFTTQDFAMVTKRLRLQTNYIYQLEKTPIHGVIQVDVFDYDAQGKYIKTIIFDGRPFFAYYDTNEIITLKE